MAARWAAYLARCREHLHGVESPIHRPSRTFVSVWSADDSAAPMTPGAATDSRPEAAASRSASAKVTVLRELTLARLAASAAPRLPACPRADLHRRPAAADCRRPECGSIGAQFVGHQKFRRKPLLSEKLAHQPQRRSGVPAALHQHVEDPAFVVNGTPEIHPLASDPNNHLVQVSSIARAGAALP